MDSSQTFCGQLRCDGWVRRTTTRGIILDNRSSNFLKDTVKCKRWIWAEKGSSSFVWMCAINNSKIFVNYGVLDVYVSVLWVHIAPNLLTHRSIAKTQRQSCNDSRSVCLIELTFLASERLGVCVCVCMDFMHLCVCKNLLSIVNMNFDNYRNGSWRGFNHNKWWKVGGWRGAHCCRAGALEAH